MAAMVGIEDSISPAALAVMPQLSTSKVARVAISLVRFRAPAWVVEVPNRCFIPVMGAMTALLAVGEEAVVGPWLGMVGEAVQQGASSSVVVLRHSRTRVVVIRAGTHMEGLHPFCLLDNVRG
jgi:hypothetical protein